MQSNTEYIEIALESLVLDAAKSFDLYLNLAMGEEERRHVLYLTPEVDFTEEARSNLIAKGISRLYIAGDQEGQYLQYLEQNLGKIISDPSVPPEKKTSLLCRSAYFAAKGIFEKPDKHTIQRGKDVARHVVSLNERSDSISAIELSRITSDNRNLFVRAGNVMIFGIPLARRLLPDASKESMESLSLAFLLHDIGKCTFPSDIMEREHALTVVKRQELRGHPSRGAAIVAESGYLNDEIQFVVEQHHERLDGSGYPKGLKNGDINPLALICAVADRYERLTASTSTHTALSCFDALKAMKIQIGTHFPKESFEQFVLMFPRDD